MRSLTSFRIVAIALAVVVAAGLLFAAARPSAAGAPNVSGLWTANYALACSGSLDQTGSDVTGSLVCGTDIVLEVSGSFSDADGAVSLSSQFAGVPVTITGALLPDGRSIEGSWSAPPLVDSGDFFAVREDEPSTEHIAGFWLVNARNIFSNQCTLAIQQDGMQLAAEVDCQDGPSGDLAGAFDADTGNVSMIGAFGDFGTLEVRVNVAEDGGSYSGAWRLLQGGPAGVMDGERLPEPTATPVEATAEAHATATPSIQLPDTGGRAQDDAAPWATTAIAVMLAFGATCALASYRLR